MKRLRPHPNLCIGCKLCVLECSFYHNNAFGEALARLWVNVDEEHWAFTPVVCRQCGKAPCLTACPLDAISRDDATGALFLDQERCDGCRLCVKACPFDAIVFNEEAGIVQLCDLCYGEPRCVSTCPVGAIKYA